LYWYRLVCHLFCIGSVGILVGTTPAVAESVTAPSIARANAEATLSSVIAGTIVALPIDEGGDFREGDILARLNCELQEAEAAALSAEQEAAQSRSIALERLFKRGGAGRTEVEVAKSMTTAATAKLKSAEVRLKGCVITAPFDGKLSNYAVNTFEYVEPSNPLFSIVSSGKPDVEIIAPDTWLRWIAPGMVGQVELEAAVSTFDIVVTSIAPVVDPVSRTVKLSAAFQGNANGVLPGMTGRVKFEASQ